MSLADIITGVWGLLIVIAIAIVGFGLSAMGTFDKDNDDK